MNARATLSVVVVRRALHMTPFPSRSVITMRFVRPLLSGSLSMKSMEISLHNLSGIGRGFRKPCFRSLQGLLRPQTSQFRTKRRIHSSILGQKTSSCRVSHFALCVVIISDIPLQEFLEHQVHGTRHPGPGLPGENLNSLNIGRPSLSSSMVSIVVS